MPASVKVSPAPLFWDDHKAFLKVRRGSRMLNHWIRMTVKWSETWSRCLPSKRADSGGRREDQQIFTLDSSVFRICRSRRGEGVVTTPTDGLDYKRKHARKALMGKGKATH